MLSLVEPADLGDHSFVTLGDEDSGHTGRDVGKQRDRSRISPDLKWISFVSNRDGSSRIWLLDRASGAERSISPPNGGVGYHVWSPASDRIAFVGLSGNQGTLTIVSIAGDNPQLFRLRSSSTALVRWIGEGIYYLPDNAGAESLWRLDLRTGQSAEITTARGALALRSCDVTEDEKHIVFTAVQDGFTMLFHADIDGRNAIRLAETRLSPKDPRWKGASTREVVYLSEEGGMVDIWQIDVATRKRQRLTVTDDRERGIDVSSDGAIVVYGEIRETAHLAMLDPAQSKPIPTPLTSDSLNDLLPAVSASDTAVVFQRSTTIDTAMGEKSATVQLSADFLKSPSIKLGDGYGPEISPDGRFVTYSVWRPGELAQLWLVDALERRPMLLTESFIQFSYNPFPLARTTTNLVWAQGSVLYFLARDSSGCAQVWRVQAAASGQTPGIEQVTHVAEKTISLRDVRVSIDGRQLSYLARWESRGLTDLHVVDIPRMEDSVLFSESTRARLASPGWTATGAVVVLRPEPARSVTSVLLVGGGKAREVGQLREPTLGSVTLDLRRDLLYFAQLRGQVRSLHAFSLASGQVRQVFEAEPHGPAFSGIRVLGDGRLLFSSQRQNHDILASEFGK